MLVRRFWSSWISGWLPLTDSDRLVSDVSKLLSILLDLIDVREGAEKPCKTYTPEQRGSLENCSDAFDVHHIHYDPQVAKELAAHLAQCLVTGVLAVILCEVCLKIRQYASNLDSLSQS